MKIGRRLQYLNHLIDCYRIARSHLYILIPDSIHFMRAVVISLTLELGVTVYFSMSNCQTLYFDVVEVLSVMLLGSCSHLAITTTKLAERVVS